MADVAILSANGTDYNVKDATAREDIANLDTVKLASEGGASGSIRFGVDGDGNYGYYKAGADTVTPFKNNGDLPDSTRLIKSGSGTTSFSFNTNYDQLCIIAWGGSTVSTYVRLNGVALRQLGLNNMYETVALCFNYKAGDVISVATDPSGYRVYEVYKAT